MPNLDQPPTNCQSCSYWNTDTLQNVCNAAFYKQDADQVNKDVDLAFIELLKNDISDDATVRTNLINSWFATKKLITLIDKKEFPDDVTTIVVNSDL